jgi:hypothetical protein
MRKDGRIRVHVFLGHRERLAIVIGFYAFFESTVKG